MPQAQDWFAENAPQVAPPPPPPPEPRGAFSLEPKTGAQFRTDLEASTAQVAQIAEDHPAVMAVLSLAAGAPAIGRALMANGLTAAGRAVAGGKAALQAATPQIKYEVVKQLLEMGKVHPALAMPISMWIAGRGGPKPAPAAPAASAAPPQPAPAPAPQAVAPGPQTNPARVVGGPTPAASAAAPAPSTPLASPPVAPAPPAAAVASTPVPTPPAVSTPASRTGPSPQMVRNELGIYARRAKLTLTPEIEAQATALVQQGKTPAQAIAEIHISQGGSAPVAQGSAAPAPTPAAAPHPNIPSTPAEVEAYTALRRTGKLTHKQAMKAIEQQRALAGQVGSMSPEEMQREIAARIDNRSPNRDK